MLDRNFTHIMHKNVPGNIHILKGFILFHLNGRISKIVLYLFKFNNILVISIVILINQIL